MTEISRIDQAQLQSVLTTGAGCSQESLSSADSSILLALMNGMLRRWPAQDQEAAVEEYFKDFERLSLKYSLQKVRSAIQSLRVRAGQRFFPRPDEVADEIELRAEQRQQDLRQREIGSYSRQVDEWIAKYNSPEEVAWRKEQGYA